ncbi:unnamed protein product [Prorocentrum cordatum]|uniref:Nuclear pore protein n=1 Tax=Prorocentrum cordatum TaxID=2364126 RepID=A0ABN9RFG8_9DINO|nr:unnamed protein product [Polarella glacialis]
MGACERDQQWQLALSLLVEIREAKLEPDVISQQAGVRAYDKSLHAMRVPSLLSEMRKSGIISEVLDRVHAEKVLGQSFWRLLKAMNLWLCFSAELQVAWLRLACPRLLGRSYNHFNVALLSVLVCLV